MTWGEAGLALFIFGLVYGANFLPKLVTWIGGPSSDGDNHDG